MIRCKNCLHKGKLAILKDFKYQFDKEDPVEHLDVLKCPVCGCIHWINEDSKWEWEYLVGYKEESNEVNWIIDQQIKQQNKQYKEIIC